jgi:hypothetical protein
MQTAELLPPVDANPHPTPDVAPPEYSQPAPIKLSPEDVARRLTPGDGVWEDNRGTMIITSAAHAPGPLKARQEQLTHHLTNSFAARAVSKFMDERNQRRVERVLFNDFAPRSFKQRMQPVKDRISAIRDHEKGTAYF